MILATDSRHRHQRFNGSAACRGETDGVAEWSASYLL